MLATYKAGSDLIGKAALFAILLVAARAVSLEDFGLFSLASTLGWILSVGTDFGLQVYAAREIVHTPSNVSAIVRPILRLRFALSSAAAVVTLALAFAWLPPREAAAFTIIVCAYLASGLVEFLNYVYRAVSRTDIESTLALAQRLGSLAAALFLLRLSPTLWSLAIALSVPAAVALAVSLTVTTRLGGDAAAGAVTVRAFAFSTFARDVFPLGAGIVLSALYFRLDLFLVEYWRGIGEVALYNAVFRLVEALRLFPAAILAVLLPVVFKEPTTRFVLRLSIGLTVFGLLVTAVLYPLVPRVLDLTYGSRFLEGAAPFRVLLLAFPLLALNYGLTHAIIGQGGQRRFAAGCAAGLAANLALNALMIPRLGATGAAWATLGTEAFLTAFWLAVLARRRLDY